MPDPACNPYLAFAVMIAAGLDGVKRQLDPGAPVARNIYEMTEREKKRAGIKSLPEDLNEAVREMQKDPIVRAALGDHLFEHFVAAKQAEWHEYVAAVHPWELDRYLTRN
jgi:glutamine synthetase